jgi:hypothetical protein
VSISSALRFGRHHSQDTQQMAIRSGLTMSTDRVIEYDNARVTKIFSNEMLQRKLDIEVCLAVVSMAFLPSFVTTPCGFLQRAT